MVANRALEERTSHFYEINPAYPAPPLPPLASTKSKESFRLVGIQPGSPRYYITRAALVLSGYTRFERTLDRRLDSILRTTNLKLPGPAAPIRSATLGLESDPNQTDPIARAVSLIMAIRALFVDLRDGRLEPDRHGEDILEMGLYPNLFSTNLTVVNGELRLFKSADFKKVNVVVGRRFYILDVGSPDEPLCSGSLYRALQAIREDSCSRPRAASQFSIGLISAADNDTLIAAAQTLETEPNGRAALEALRNVFFTLCMDMEAAPQSESEAVFLAQNRNHENRWHQSSLQLVVFGNAQTALIMNFSAGLDGNTMTRGASEIFLRLADRAPKVSEGSGAPLSYCEIDSSCPEHLAKRIQNDLIRISDEQTATFRIQGVGRSSLSADGVSAVGAFVIALERTIMDAVARPARIHQFLSMSKFRCMGLLTENVATNEVLECASALGDPDRGASEMLELVRRAVASQRRKTRARRSECPIDYLFRIYEKRQAGRMKRWTGLVVRAAERLQKRNWGGLFMWEAREVLISHPTICPGVPVIGRPGVRLPYVRFLALHYQIFEDSITITLMPAPGFRVTNEDLINALTENLKRMASILHGSEQRKENLRA